MLGHSYKNKQCGYYGDLSTFSFYANKHITTGEGGMILTNSKKHMNSCKSLRNLSLDLEATDLFTKKSPQIIERQIFKQH